MMSREFWTFTFGNVLTIFGGVSTLGMLWWRIAQKDQKTDDRIESLLSRQKESEDEIKEMRRLGILTTVAQHERRLTECEATLKAIAGITSDIGWIKRELERKQ